MKTISVSIENISNCNIRVTGRHDGRTVLSKEGIADNVKTMFAVVMDRTCGMHRISGNCYDLTYIELNDAARLAFDASFVERQAITKQPRPVIMPTQKSVYYIIDQDGNAGMLELSRLQTMDRIAVKVLEPELKLYRINTEDSLHGVFFNQDYDTFAYVLLPRPCNKSGDIEAAQTDLSEMISLVGDQVKVIQPKQWLSNPDARERWYERIHLAVSNYGSKQPKPVAELQTEAVAVK